MRFQTYRSSGRGFGFIVKRTPLGSMVDDPRQRIAWIAALRIWRRHMTLSHLTYQQPKRKEGNDNSNTR